MVKILLKSKGHYSEKCSIITPTSYDELMNEIVSIAMGYHYDFDSVKGYVFNDTNLDNDFKDCYPACSDHEIEEIFALDHYEFKTGNLLFTSDDDLYYDDSTDTWFDSDKNSFSSKEDALEFYTRQDYSDEIADLYNEYNRRIEK